MRAYYNHIRHLALPSLSSKGNTRDIARVMLRPAGEDFQSRILPFINITPANPMQVGDAKLRGYVDFCDCRSAGVTVFIHDRPKRGLPGFNFLADILKVMRA